MADPKPAPRRAAVARGLGVALAMIACAGAWGVPTWGGFAVLMFQFLLGVAATLCVAAEDSAHGR